MKDSSDDNKIQALLDFTNEVIRNSDLVTDEALQKTQDVGFTSKTLLEATALKQNLWV